MSSENDLMNLHLSRITMILNPLLNIGLAHHVVIQYFDGHQKLDKVYIEPFEFVIQVGVFIAKLVEGGESQQHEQTRNRDAGVVGQSLEHLRYKEKAIEVGLEFQEIVALYKVLLDPRTDVLKPLFVFLLSHF